MHRKLRYVSKHNELVQLVVQVQYHVNVIYGFGGEHTHTDFAGGTHARMHTHIPTSRTKAISKTRHAPDLKTNGEKVPHSTSQTHSSYILFLAIAHILVQFCTHNSQIALGFTSCNYTWLLLAQSFPNCTWTCAVTYTNSSKGIVVHGPMISFATVRKKNLAVKNFGEFCESVKIRQSFFHQPSRLSRQHFCSTLAHRQTFCMPKFRLWHSPNFFTAKFFFRTVLLYIALIWLPDSSFRCMFYCAISNYKLCDLRLIALLLSAVLYRR